MEENDTFKTIAKEWIAKNERVGAGLAVLWSGSGLPDLLVAFIMAALGISGGWLIVRQSALELRDNRVSASLSINRIGAIGESGASKTTGLSDLRGDIGHSPRFR